MREFLATYASSYVSERLRADWLRVLGKRSDWQEFERQAKGSQAGDLEVSCYRSSARLERGDEDPGADAMAMWLEPSELPEGCQRLSVMLAARGRISVTDVWRRVRLLFEHGAVHIRLLAANLDVDHARTALRRGDFDFALGLALQGDLARRSRFLRAPVRTNVTSFDLNVSRSSLPKTMLRRSMYGYA